MNKKLLVKKRGEFIPELSPEIPADGIVSVGSDASATIELEDEAVAPEQFVIVCENGQLTLLCRVENTVINGKLLPKGSLYNLELHDTVIVGDYSLSVEPIEAAEKLMSGDTEEISSDEETAGEVQTAAPEKSTENNQISPDADKSLSDVLEGLKAEEKFYFLIENGSPEKRRIDVESEEMWLGWTAAGECAISENPADIAKPRAQIRKDWSGVMLYPLKNKNIRLNDAALDEPRRLKNADTLQLLGKEKALPDARTNIKFFEPTALLALDSILPKELPPPVSLDKTGKAQGVFDERPSKTAEPNAKNQTFESIESGRFFGYFTALEILIMIAGILVAAALIFLVLEYY